MIRPRTLPTRLTRFSSTADSSTRPRRASSLPGTLRARRWSGRNPAAIAFSTCPRSWHQLAAELGLLFPHLAERRADAGQRWSSRPCSRSRIGQLQRRRLWPSRAVSRPSARASARRVGGERLVHPALGKHRALRHPHIAEGEEGAGLLPALAHVREPAHHLRRMLAETSTSPRSPCTRASKRWQSASS